MTQPGVEAAAAAEGAAAEAIRAAETALARQGSVTAQVDLQVVTAVLNAHAAHGDGAAALESLKADIEAAVATRTGLDTPAGAREFQRYLIDKLHDIRTVVENTDLDDTSKATLAAGLAALYASSGSASTGPAGAEPSALGAGAAAPAGAGVPAPAPDASVPLPDPLPLPLDLADPGPAEDFPAPVEPASPPSGPGPAAAATPPPVPGPAPAVPQIPALPALGGGIPGLGPLGGLSAVPPFGGPAGSREEPDELPPAETPGEEATPGDEADSPIPDVIADAVSGTPIPEAFDRQGITIPEPGTPVGAPLDSGQVVAGDIAVFGDRHGLALGNGRALIDDQIQPIETVDRPGFLGWQHPPEPDPQSAPD